MGLHRRHRLMQMEAGRQKSIAAPVDGEGGAHRSLLLSRVCSPSFWRGEQMHKAASPSCQLRRATMRRQRRERECLRKAHNNERRLCGHAPFGGDQKSYSPLLPALASKLFDRHAFFKIGRTGPILPRLVSGSVQSLGASGQNAV